MSRPTRADRILTAAIFASVLAVTLAAAPRQGIHRDEAYYMDAGEQYATYWEHVVTGRAARPLSRETIDRYWGYNHEHPPLFKLLYGLSWRAFHRCDCAAFAPYHPAVARLDGGRHVTLALLDEVTAFRLPTMLAFAALCALVYWFCLRAFGGRAGALAAALLMAAQPRAFFHAQTASFDLPAATLWFACAYAWWRSLDGGRRAPALALGLLYGAFLATKLQSFFLPLALGAHWLFLAFRRRRRGEPRPPLAPLLSMLVIGPLVFFASWPWLWHNPVARLGEYLRFHWTHVHYNFEYLGRNWNTPPYPWHEPLGLLVTTAPVVLLALAIAGAVVLARRALDVRRGALEPDPRATSALVLVTALVPIAPFLTGRAPIFGETKHWLGTMPFLAVLAGVALEALSRRLVAELGLEALSRRRTRGVVLSALVAVAALPAIVETARSHPYGLSHYNALAGGAPGGADLGMNRQFWGYSPFGLFDWFARSLPPRTRLYLHDWNHDAWELYVRTGRLRPDIVDAGMEDPGIRSSTAALVIHERHFNKYEYMIWNTYGHLRPSKVLALDGVPLVTVYQR